VRRAERHDPLGDTGLCGLIFHGVGGDGLFFHHFGLGLRGHGLGGGGFVAVGFVGIAAASCGHEGDASKCGNECSGGASFAHRLLQWLEDKLGPSFAGAQVRALPSGANLPLPRGIVIASTTKATGLKKHERVRLTTVAGQCRNLTGLRFVIRQFDTLAVLT
jgi:hypothetical protein